MPRSAARRLVALVFAASGLAVTAPVTAAAGIVVTSLGSAMADDGACTLNEAVHAANTDTASGQVAGECPAGSGADVVTFSVAGTIYGGAWDITHDLVIDGGGTITIDATGVGGGSQHLLVEPGVTATVRGLTLTGGVAQYSGSIYNGGTLTVERTTITGNAASQWGGGILNQGGATLLVRDSTISDNYGGLGGGVYVEATSTATITGSTISGNTSTDSGALYVAGTLVLANSTVAGNTAEGAYAGIRVAGNAASATLLNVTVTGNGTGATGNTGGDGLDVDASSSVTVKNTIIAGNGDTATQGTIDTAVANVIQVPAAGLLDPLGLRANGGPTKTVRLLVTGVAAIDDGDATTCASAPVGAVDQRGMPRPSGAGCDIGAVERDGVLPTTGTPSVKLATGVTMAGASPRVTVTWTGSDTGGSGLAGFILQRSSNGGTTYATVGSVLASPTAAVAIATGASYRFRVAALDGDGNQGAWDESRVLSASVTQQTYGGLTWIGTWRAQSGSSYSGGSIRYATKARAYTRYLFTGRGIAFVSTRASTRGRATIYINGVRKATIDLRGATAFRHQAWAYTWSTTATRTIKVVVSGTSGRPRIDADAFIVLR